MRPPIKRWRYIVDWNLQGSLIIHGLVYGGLVLVAVSLGIFSPLLWDLEATDPATHYEEQAIVMLYLHEQFWPLLAMCLVIVVVGAIRYSHRVAGPMVRYKRYLRMLANGKIPPPLRTRRRDFMKEEVACLNKAMLGVSERVEAIRRAQVELQCKLTDHLAECDGVSEELTAVVAACDDLQRAVGNFQHVHEDGHQKPSVEQVVAPVLAEPVGSA